MVSQSYRFKVAGESPLGWHTLTHGDVEIDVVPEGGRAKDSSPTLIPSPLQMGVSSGLHYASIEGWVELKISSGRQKDQAHVVEVLKKSDAETVQRIGWHLKQVHGGYLDRFEFLRREAEEGQQERNRKH